MNYEKKRLERESFLLGYEINTIAIKSLCFYAKGFSRVNHYPLKRGNC